MNRDEFLYWWPVVARLAGVVGAFGQAGYAVVTHQAADAAFIGFCVALIAAPNIFPVKSDARGGDDSDKRPERPSSDA